MNKKFISKSSFIYVLFFIILITTLLSTTVFASSKLKKRAPEVCPYSKRSELFKRTNVCPCTVARATFSNKVTGFIFLSQNNCDTTTFVGKFSAGFKKGRSYSFLVVDACDNIIKDVTQQLNVQFNNDGGTEAFNAVINNINLNCNSNGILGSSSTSSKRKRTCNKTDWACLRIDEGGSKFVQTRIEEI